MNTQRGAALLLALWALVLLSVVMTAALANVRLENRQSNYALRRAQALCSAEAGIALAVQGLLAPGKAIWLADGKAHALTFDGTALSVSVESERGKLDLNLTPQAMYAHVMTELGASAQQTRQFLQALETRRLTQQPIVSLEDIQTFPGMTPALYQQLLPNISLWSGAGTPSQSFATPTVQKILALNVGQELSDPGQIFTIRSRAQLQEHFSAELVVTLQLNPGNAGSPLYRVLRWQE